MFNPLTLSIGSARAPKDTMSKEFIRPNQFAQVDMAAVSEQENLELDKKQLQELEELYCEIFNFDTKKPIKGTIVKANSDGVLVDIGFKSDGHIPRYEFGPHELKSFKAGDEIEVIIDELESIGGNVILSYEKAKALRAWDRISKLFEEVKPVEGIVTHKVKGGLSVDIGVPAFLPGSQIDLQRVTDFDHWVGQKLTAHILKINKKRGNVIISRRKHLSDQRAGLRKDILDQLDVAQVIKGMVKNITNYGVFIDIGGVDGLLHITDMTWGRISHPSELVKIGDAITVKVLSFDKDNEKISLGLKQLSDNPWEKIGETLKISDKIKGKISSITDYGMFIEVMPGIEGLVHISEVSWTDRINNLANKYKIGQEIEALIVSLDTENRRMSLSIKQLDKNPWEKVHEQFKVGQKVNGAVSNITDFGIFVQLMPGIDGLVHVSDLSWTEHIEHPSSVYKKGDMVEAMILGIDPEKKKISLGVKQLAEDPWDKINEQYPVGSIIDGEVSKITTFGAFVRLSSGIEGLVHASDLPNQKIEDVLQVGLKRQFRVINANKEEHKLGLSVNLEGEIFAPRRKARADKPKMASTPKAKSAFQVAMEEHAARKLKDTEEDN